MKVSENGRTFQEVCQEKNEKSLEKFLEKNEMRGGEMLQKVKKNRGETVILERAEVLKNGGCEFPRSHTYSRR